MLNLQTIAESLNTKCAGRSWVFVTSQEDMEKVIGDRTTPAGQRLLQDPGPLQDAPEAHQRRRRGGHPQASAGEERRRREPRSSTIYADQHANFKTLFDFVDGAKTYRNYTDEAHFVGTYPFVSYQFPLFQAAIEGISDHNVFEGRNSSVGERSMLGVVQQVAKDIGNVEVGQLATFDSMFAGIRASLKSAAQRSIDVAERNLDNPLAVRLLKALFLVKYVESFQATPRNLTVLVYDRFGLDLPALSEQVKEALTLLETQTYIQRNGNTYEYLTNEEQVIEEEIKNVDIDASEVSGRLFKILSGDVIKTNKIRYAKNGQDFPFGFKLDDQAHGPQRELAVHFISPEYPYTPEEIRMHSAGKDELRVILEPDARVLADLRLLIKTEKYIKRKQGTSISAIEGQILQTKGAQNIDREKELIERVKTSVGKSALIINAADITSSSQDALVRVTDGFQDLISRTYTQLKLLGGVDLQRAAGRRGRQPGQRPVRRRHRQQALRARGGGAVVRPAQGDPRRAGHGQDHRRQLHRQALRLGPRLDRGPDRVPDRHLQGHAHGRRQRPQALRGRRRRCATPRSIRTPWWHRRRPSTSARSLPSASSAPTSSTRATPRRIRWSWPGTARTSSRPSATNSRPRMTGSKYPFVSQLAAPIDLLDQVVGKPDDWYLTDFNLGDDLLDAKESTIDPIQAFLSGGQKVIYDEAADLLTTHSSNLGYLPPDSDATVRTALDDPNAFRGNKMAQLKQATDQLRTQIDEVVAPNRTDVVEAIEGRKAEIEASAFYAKATPVAQESVLRRVDQTISRVRAQNQIALIRETRVELRGEHLPGAARPAGRCAAHAAMEMVMAVRNHRRSRPCPSRPSRPPASPGCWRRRRTSTATSPPSVTALVQTLNAGKRISL